MAPPHLLDWKPLQAVRMTVTASSSADQVSMCLLGGLSPETRRRKKEPSGSSGSDTSPSGSAAKAASFAAAVSDSDMDRSRTEGSHPRTVPRRPADPRETPWTGRIPSAARSPRRCAPCRPRCAASPSRGRARPASPDATMRAGSPGRRSWRSGCEVDAGDPAERVHDLEDREPVAAAEVVSRQELASLLERLGRRDVGAGRCRRRGCSRGRTTRPGSGSPCPRLAVSRRRRAHASRPGRGCRATRPRRPGTTSPPR